MRGIKTSTAAGSVRRRSRKPADAWLGLSDDVIGRFVDVLLVEHGYSRYTCAGYRTDVRNLDRWLRRADHCTLVSATDRQLIRYLSDRIRRGCSANTLRRLLLSLRRFYDFLCASHIRDDNPMCRPQVTRKYAGLLPGTSTLRRQRESRQAAAERDRVMLALMIASGMHAAQLIALRMTDLHLEEGHVSTGERSAEGIVALSPGLIETLQRYLLEARKALISRHDSDRVFPSCGGRALSCRQFWRVFRRRADGMRAPIGGRGSGAPLAGWHSTSRSLERSNHDGA